MKAEVKTSKRVLWIAVVFAAALFIWFAVGICQIMIKTHGYVRTAATVDKIIYNDYRSANNDASTVTTYYQVSYTDYADCTGKQYTTDIAKGMFINKTEGDKLTVYYNSNSPEELRPDISNAVFAVIISGFILAGVIMLIIKGDFTN